MQLQNQTAAHYRSTDLDLDGFHSDIPDGSFGELPFVLSSVIIRDLHFADGSVVDWHIAALSPVSLASICV